MSEAQELQAEIERLRAHLTEADAAHEKVTSAAQRSAFDRWHQRNFTLEERMTDPGLVVEQLAAFRAGWNARAWHERASL